MRKKQKRKTKKTSLYYLNKMKEFMISINNDLENISPSQILYFSSLNNLYSKRLKVEERMLKNQIAKEEARKKREEESFLKQKEDIIMNQNLSEIKEMRKALKGILK